MSTTRNEYAVYHTDGKLWEGIKKILPVKLQEIEKQLEKKTVECVKLKAKNAFLVSRLHEREEENGRTEEALKNVMDAYTEQYLLLEEKDREIADLRRQMTVRPSDAPPGPVGAQNASACYTVYGL